MRLGLALHPDPSADNSVAELIERSRAVYEQGIPRVWLAQLPTTEALSLAPILSTAIPELQIGTSVVTMIPRHPLVVGVQARIARAAAPAGFTLGLGLGAPALEDRHYGIDDDRRLGRLAEFLEVANALRAGGRVEHHGSLFTAVSAGAPVAGGEGFRLLVAAMGPKSLALAGQQADGTLPNLAGPRTLESFIVPTIAEAARRADRDTPEIVTAVAVVVTDDPNRVRATALEKLAFYGQIPSYRAALDREGVDHPAEVALIGDEDTVRRGLERLIDAGATELVITQTDLGGPEDEQRTWATVGALARG